MNIIAIKASLPESVALVVCPLPYTDFSSTGETGVAMRGAIYLFETEAKNAGNLLEETCIVVGGFFGDDYVQTCYRVDFLVPGEESC